MNQLFILRENMTDSRLFGETFQMMTKSLDISSRRHNLITGNIANMDTVGYKPEDLDFRKNLEKAMAGKEPETMSRTNEKHLSGVDAKGSYLEGQNSEDVDTYHLDSVNIDREMTNLVENNIKYRSTSELLLRKLDKLKYAITEGGR
ncbi:MAG: flagellar basal body rod protein FlgB [Desulfobacteraceae bacterium]